MLIIYLRTWEVNVRDKHKFYLKLFSLCSFYKNKTWHVETLNTKKICWCLRRKFRKFYDKICKAFALKADSRIAWPNNFEMFQSYFLLKKRKPSNCRFRSIFIVNKKEPQWCQFATYQRNALFEFLTPQTGQMAFPIFKVIMR